MNTPIDSALVVELFEELKEQTLVTKRLLETQSDQLRRSEQQHSKALQELAAMCAKRPTAVAAPPQVVREVVHQLPKPLPEQVLRHKHSLDMQGVRTVLLFVAACAAAATFGYLYIDKAFEASKYKESNTKYLYILSKGSIDSVGLEDLEAFFADPSQSDRRAELESRIDQLYPR